MDAARIAEARAVVSARIEETRQAIAAQQSDGGAIAPDNAIGRISRMGAMYDKQVNEATLQRAKDRLAKLEYVLDHIDTPEFGRCEFCRQPIRHARGLAMPESTVCVRCAAPR